MALPTVPPPPVTTWSCSAGRPHSSMSSSASAMDENGVWLAGFSTTGQPAAMAGATLCATRLSGKLNGAMAPTTPIGTRSVKPSLPSPAAPASSGIISPASLRASAAANENVPDGPLGLDPGGLDGLGRFAGDDAGEVLAAFGQQARRGVQDLGPLPQREGAGGERGPRRGDGAVDVLLGAGRHLPQHGPVVGRLDGDGLGGGVPLPGQRQRTDVSHGPTILPACRTRSWTIPGPSRSPTAEVHSRASRTRCPRSRPRSRSGTGIWRRTRGSPPTACCVAFHDDDLSRTLRSGRVDHRAPVVGGAEGSGGRQGADPADGGPAGRLPAGRGSTWTPRATGRWTR